MKNQLNFISRTSINRYIQFYREYPDIVDTWKKDGHEIDDLTVTKGLELRAKLKQKRGKTLEEQAKQTIRLKRKDKDNTQDDNSPLKKKTKS